MAMPQPIPPPPGLDRRTRRIGPAAVVASAREMVAARRRPETDAMWRGRPSRAATSRRAGTRLAQQSAYPRAVRLPFVREAGTYRHIGTPMRKITPRLSLTPQGHERGAQVPKMTRKACLPLSPRLQPDIALAPPVNSVCGTLLKIPAPAVGRRQKSHIQHQTSTVGSTQGSNAGSQKTSTHRAGATSEPNTSPAVDSNLPIANDAKPIVEQNDHSLKVEPASLCETSTVPPNANTQQAHSDCLMNTSSDSAIQGQPVEDDQSNDAVSSGGFSVQNLTSSTVGTRCDSALPGLLYT